MTKKLYTLFAALVFAASTVHAQVGEHRSDLAVGVNGGYVLSNVGFVPKVTQGMQTGITGGMSMRYVCEKYFQTICSVQAEVNYTQAGWKESILNENELPCVNNVTGEPEQYERSITYIQVPVMAHLAWGKEHKGAQFFFQVGPQLGYMLSEATKTNFDIKDVYDTTPDRVNPTCAQDTMAVENAFDYGIAAGAGMEIGMGRMGHLQLEARYYFGLGNIYGDTKRDYFSKSNHSNIVFKLAWLFDIVRTKRR